MRLEIYGFQMGGWEADRVGGGWGRGTRAGVVLASWILALLFCGCGARGAGADGPVQQNAPLALASTATLTATANLPLVARDRGDGAGGVWRPPVGASWQWQLTGLPVDDSFDVDVYDLDLFEVDAATVAALHAQGRKVVCYLSAGSWEEWRPDAGAFPEEVLGNDYEGWPGERWLDVRRIDLLAPIVRARLDRCREVGFDGVEPDNVDGYANDTGFALTYEDQLRYNRWLADEAHARGLSIGLKNDEEQVGDLLAHYDWALTEDCFADGWCAEMTPFVDAGVAVFAAEYTDRMTVAEFVGQVCPQAEALRFSAILKRRDLDAWSRECPNP